MSNMRPCYICGKVYDHDYVFHTNKGECDREIQKRQMQALESIAASLEKISNSPITMVNNYNG